MSSILAGLGSILVSALVKLIGYDFVVKVLVIALKAWSETTKSEKDDQVVAAMAEAWGVSDEKIKKLGS